MITPYVETDINAAASIIGDISTGIYRSPGNALKELVNNSFDAGATEVIINTDYPHFSSVTCYDNGPGISLEGLQLIFRYIGGSDKRVAGDMGHFGRPLIGRIGIGILAMSQISDRFVIISSQQGNPTRIEAEINISEFETGEAAVSNLGAGKIGRLRIYQMAESEDEHYTIVATPASSAALKRNLGQGTTPRELFAHQSRDQESFRAWVESLSQGPRPEKLTDYELFLWELAALSPVPYFDDGPVRGWNGWDHVKERLLSYNFRLVVDGYQMRKPVLLPSSVELHEIGGDFQIYPIHHQTNINTRLEFEGYIFHQRRQILPPQLQGLLVRIRDVGIGAYATDLLNYPINPGPMVHGMSGEVHVYEGLEIALNIDRNSFNETHSHYQRLQESVYLHLGLPDAPGITRDIRARSKTRQDAIRRDQVHEELERTRRRLTRISGEHWTFQFIDTIDSPVLVDPDHHIAFVNLNHDTVPTGQAARKEFFRVCLTSRLATLMASPGNESDAFVAWLRLL